MFPHITSSTAYIRPSVDYSSEQQQQNRSYLKAEPGLAFTVCTRCAAAEKRQSEPGLKLRCTLNILDSRTNRSWLPFMKSSTASRTAHVRHWLKNKPHISISRFNLSLWYTWRTTPLTWNFVLSVNLLTGKTKGRLCEQHGTPYLCFEDEIFSRNSVEKQSDLVCSFIC